MTFASIEKGLPYVYSAAKMYSTAVEVSVKNAAITTTAAVSIAQSAIKAVTSSGSMVWGAVKFITGIRDFQKGLHTMQPREGQPAAVENQHEKMRAHFEMGALKAFGSSVWAIGTVGNWFGATGATMGAAKLFAGAVNATGRAAFSFCAPIISHSLKGATAAAIVGIKGASSAIELALDHPAMIPNAALTTASLACLYVACSQGVAAADAQGWGKLLPAAKAAAGVAGTCFCAALIL